MAVSRYMNASEGEKYGSKKCVVKSAKCAGCEGCYSIKQNVPDAIFNIWETRDKSNLL